MTVLRVAFGFVLVAMVGIVGYRVVSTGPDELPADTLSTAERLRVAPLDGDAFSDLAVAMREKGDPEATLVLHEIAERRDPRDLRIRVWLAERFLRAGEYQEALEQLDVVLRLSPEARATLPALMVQWTDDPDFATALAAKLGDETAWRAGMIAALRADIERQGVGAIFAALRESGDLDDAELTRWLDALMQAGKWGLAYSYWASALDLQPGAALPMLYNGGFEQAPSQQGFDWRTERHSGTYTEFEPGQGAHGNAAHLVFHGRPVEAANLEQALALSPGRYEVSMRVKAAALRSDQGLHWVVVCHGQPRPLASGERFEGSFGWRESTFEFEIPGGSCPGQWFRLGNPAPGGSASSVSGDLWIDDMVLHPLNAMASNSRH